MASMKEPWTIDMLVSRYAVDAVRKAFFALKPKKALEFETLIRTVSENARIRWKKAKEIVTKFFQIQRLQ